MNRSKSKLMVVPLVILVVAIAVLQAHSTVTNKLRLQNSAREWVIEKAGPSYSYMQAEEINTVLVGKEIKTVLCADAVYGKLIPADKFGVVCLSGEQLFEREDEWYGEYDEARSHYLIYFSKYGEDQLNFYVSESLEDQVTLMHKAQLITDLTAAEGRLSNMGGIPITLGEYISLRTIGVRDWEKSTTKFRPTPNFEKTLKVAMMIKASIDVRECSSLPQDYYPEYPLWDRADRFGIYCYHWAGFNVKPPDYAFSATATQKWSIYSYMDEEGNINYYITQEDAHPFLGVWRFGNLITEEAFETLKLASVEEFK